MLNLKMQEYTQALYDRCRDSRTGEIIDPITQEKIEEKDVWIFNYNEESVSYTSIQTLYKSLVIDNKTVSPFDRTPIDKRDIDIIEEYGRARKVRVRFFDGGRNYDSPYRDTMYIFDWFLRLEQMLIRVFKATFNMQRHKTLLFELNGNDITEYDIKAEIETMAVNGEIILSAVENPEHHQETQNESLIVQEHDSTTLNPNEHNNVQSQDESESEELEEQETINISFLSPFANIFRAFVPPSVPVQQPAQPEVQQNFIGTIFERVAQNARSEATAEVIRNPNSGMMDLFNVLMTPGVTQDIPPPTDDTENFDLD